MRVLGGNLSPAHPALLHPAKRDIPARKADASAQTKYSRYLTIWIWMFTVVLGTEQMKSLP